MEFFSAPKRSPTTTKVDSSSSSLLLLDLTTVSIPLIFPASRYLLPCRLRYYRRRQPGTVHGLRRGQVGGQFIPPVSPPSLSLSFTYSPSHFSSGFTRANLSTLIWQITSQRVATTLQGSIQILCKEGWGIGGRKGVIERNREPYTVYYFMYYFKISFHFLFPPYSGILTRPAPIRSTWSST